MTEAQDKEYRFESKKTPDSSNNGHKNTASEHWNVLIALKSI